MPRATAVTVENNFSKGLITEATAMNFPENSVVSTDNCVFSKDGTVIRRFGIDYESNYAVSTFAQMNVSSDESVVLTEYIWTSVDNDGATSFLVQQIGNQLAFFEITDFNNISANRKNFSVDLDDFLVDPLQTTSGLECQFSSGFGYLFVVHPSCEPFYVQYESETDSITTAEITIRIRDFTRLDDGLAVDERPSSLTNAHKYNLYNQGWYGTVYDGAGNVNPVTEWDSIRSDFPSNADQWWVYKNADEELTITWVDRFTLPNTPAPNGHYVYNAFNVDRNTTLSVSNLTDEITNSRPTTVAFYSGRAWYAGVGEQSFSSKIYFSKIVEGTADFGECYQSNDPTSESNADLLPSDGGVINIPDIAQVVRLLAVRDAILIFCTNGIWKVSGANGVFSANDYFVSKVSSVGIRAPNSIVVVEGAPMWWDNAGIYTIQFDPNSGLEAVNNISETTIQSLIDHIPHANLRYVKGAYNALQKNIHFLYRTTDASTLITNYQYDKLLTLSVVSGSFSTHSLSTGLGPSVSGVVFSSNSNNDALMGIPQASIMKFITTGPIGEASAVGYTISQFNNSSYLDWFSFNNIGVNFSSEFITGYRVRGDLLKKFQSNYVGIIMEREENASCFFQGVWDYAVNTADGRLTSTQQVYRDDQFSHYSRVKRRVRGSGYSLQFKFFSEAGKPFTLIGWVTFDSGGNVP